MGVVKALGVFREGGMAGCEEMESPRSTDFLRRPGLGGERGGVDASASQGALVGSILNTYFQTSPN